MTKETIKEVKSYLRSCGWENKNASCYMDDIIEDINIGFPELNDDQVEEIAQMVLM